MTPLSSVASTSTMTPLSSMTTLTSTATVATAEFIVTASVAVVSVVVAVAFVALVGRLHGNMVLPGLDRQTKHLSERCTSDGVGESVVLAEVLVLQGHVPVVHGDGQLALAHQPLLCEVVVDLVLGVSQVIVLPVTVQIVGVQGVQPLVQTIPVDLLSSIILKATVASVPVVAEGVEVAVQGSVGDGSQSTFDSSTAQAKASASNMRALPAEHAVLVELARSFVSVSGPVLPEPAVAGSVSHAALRPVEAGVAAAAT